MDNWDALGMRASGSGDVIFRDSAIPDSAVTVAGQVGELSAATLPLTMVGALSARRRRARYR